MNIYIGNREEIQKTATEHLGQKDKKEIQKDLDYFIRLLDNISSTFLDVIFTKEQIEKPEKAFKYLDYHTRCYKITEVNRFCRELILECKNGTVSYYDDHVFDYCYINRFKDDKYTQLLNIGNYIKEYYLKKFKEFGILDDTIDKYIKGLENPWEIIKIIYLDIVNKKLNEQLIETTPNKLKRKIGGIIVDILDKKPDERHAILLSLSDKMKNLGFIIEELESENAPYSIDFSKIKFSFKE